MSVPPPASLHARDRSLPYPSCPRFRLRHGRSDARHEFPYRRGYTYTMRLILAALSIAVVSCTSSPTDPTEEAADGFNVRYGQTVTVAGTRISFTEINDSRCPKDVVCVWAGDAAVRLESGTEHVVLHTNPSAGSTSGK